MDQDRVLLRWSVAAFVLALHGCATLWFSWPRILAIVPFALGHLWYPTLAYSTISIATERRVSFRLAIAIVFSAMALGFYLLSFYIIIYKSGRNS